MEAIKEFGKLLGTLGIIWAKAMFFGSIAVAFLSPFILVAWLLFG